jgi:hypothetical protein
LTREVPLARERRPSRTMGFSAGHRDDKERRTLASRQTVLGSRRTLFKKRSLAGNSRNLGRFTCPRLIKVFFFPSLPLASRVRHCAAQADAGSGRTSGAPSANDAGSGPTTGANQYQRDNCERSSRVDRAPLASHRVQNQLEGLSRSRLQRQRRNSSFKSLRLPFASGPLQQTIGLTRAPSQVRRSF